jgi:hypothetical protein
MKGGWIVGWLFLSLIEAQQSLRASVGDRALRGFSHKTILLLAVTASSLVPAQSLPTVELEKFVERLSSETRVGGGLLLGATLLGEPDKGFPAPRLVLPAKPDSGPYCVETIAIDGSYWSQGELPASAIRGGEPGLRIKYGNNSKPGGASNSQILDDLGAGNLAVLVTTGSCDGARRDRRVVVADRLNEDRKGKGVRLFLNASKNDVEAVYASGTGAEVSAECFEIKSSQRQRLAYDSFCELRAPLGENTQVTVKTTRFGRKVLQVTYTLIRGDV